MAKKRYYLTAWILDGIDFLLGVPSILVSMSIIGAPVATLFNNIRGIIYDGITIPIIYSRYGGKSALISSIELIIPEEFDMFVPMATISAYSSKKKR